MLLFGFRRCQTAVVVVRHTAYDVVVDGVRQLRRILYILYLILYIIIISPEMSTTISKMIFRT